MAPHEHRKHAKQAISIFKKHFKAGLALVDPKFLLSEWDGLLPQANITLILLHNTQVIPKLSTYSCMYGEFNFRATPLALPGIKIVVHVSPDKRGTQNLNSEFGWYVGSSLSYYRYV